jgi:signal transduction histidine kinase
LNALHIHLQLMERELKKLRADSARSASVGGPGVKAQTRSQTGSREMDDTVRKFEQYLSVAKGEINRLDYIVTQFLHAIRPSAPQMKPASLNLVVEKTLELLRPELDNRGVHIKTKLARHLPLTPIDATQIQQVLVNLVQNAKQAMTRGGTLTIQTGEAAEAVWVSVADTGGGIPKEQLNLIFEPFYTTKKKGTGLGLMIVRRIIQAHRGHIEVESKVSRGTSFRIWLPLHERKPRLLEAPSHD